MYYSVNKGIPNYVTINIDVNTILNECASDKEQLKKELTSIRSMYTQKIIDIMGYSKSQHGFFGQLCTRSRYKNSENEMYIDPVLFLVRLKEILGVDNPSVNFNDLVLKQQMRDKVSVLNQIKTPEDLKQQFPPIYKDYELSIRGYENICETEMLYAETRDENIKEKSKKLWKTFKGYGLHSIFEKFMEKQCIAYRNYVERRTFVEGYCFRNPLDFENFKGLDKEKFELYMADKYLTRAYQAKTIGEAQKCLYYVTSYIREVKVSNVSIKNDSGEEVTFRKILNRYKRLLRNNEKLKPIDEDRSKFIGYNIKHVLNHLGKYYGSSVNWTIVPNGDAGYDGDIKQKIIETMNRHYSHLSLEEKRRKVQEKYDIYDRKVSFFENTKYVLKIYGISKFDGYVAFVYENGEILLERFFTDYTECMPAIGEAIYNLNIYNFEELSKYSKTKLIRDKSAKRILHTDNFEDKARIIIDREATPEVKKDVEAFVYKFKPKKNDQS